MAASIVLGAAFLFAGGAKIAAGPQWPIQAADLGAPAFTIGVVPWLEIVVGALLCARLARPLPSLAATAMLVVFSAVLTIRLARGEHPPCACFGSLSAKPLSWRHLVRNGLLLVLAVISAAG